MRVEEAMAALAQGREVADVSGVVGTTRSPEGVGHGVDPNARIERQPRLG